MPLKANKLLDKWSFLSWVAPLHELGFAEIMLAAFRDHDL